MTKEEAKRILQDEVWPVYESEKEAGNTPTVLVASMGFLTGLHRLMEKTSYNIDLATGRPDYIEQYVRAEGELLADVRIEWSGSEEDCTWRLL